MQVKIYEYPNCTWKLEGDTFFCTHDEVEIETFTEDHMGFNGHYQTESEAYVCAECGEILDGCPAEDRAEAMID